MALVTSAIVRTGGPVVGAVTGVAAGGDVAKTAKSRYEMLGGKYRCANEIVRFTRAGVVLVAMMLLIVSRRDFLVRRFEVMPSDTLNRPAFTRGAMIFLSTV